MVVIIHNKLYGSEYIPCSNSPRKTNMLCTNHMMYQPMESLLDLLRNETTQQYLIAYLPGIVYNYTLCGSFIHIM